MPFWKRPVDDEDLVDFPDAQQVQPARDPKELVRLRKKAQKAARRAALEAERAREAARKVQAASNPADPGKRAEVRATPEWADSDERSAALAKKEQRRLNRLRKKAQRSS
jgi:hypothetical protein